jgi:hypothetical protein
MCVHNFYSDQRSITICIFIIQASGVFYKRGVSEKERYNIIHVSRLKMLAKDMSGKEHKVCLNT